jgi:hypothetical protein
MVGYASMMVPFLLLLPLDPTGPIRANLQQIHGGVNSRTARTVFLLEVVGLVKLDAVTR